MSTPSSITLRLLGSEQSPRSLDRFSYRVARTRVISDVPLSALDPWRLDSPNGEAAVENAMHAPARAPVDRAPNEVERQASEPSAGEQEDVDRHQTTQDGPRESGPGLEAIDAGADAEFSRGWQDVSCRWQGRSGRLSVAGLGSIRIAVGEESVDLRVTTRSGPDRLEKARRLCLDPGLVVGLAERNIFSLRASAVINQDSIQAFLGLPGSGKSTFVSALGSGVRVADDLLSVRRARAGFEALAHVPQARLDRSEQCSTSLFESLPVSAVFVLAPLPADLYREVACVRLQSNQAFTELNRFVVGSRLFRPRVVCRNYFFCAELASLVPVFVLRYPRTLSALPAMQQAVRTVLAEDRAEAAIRTA